jgi:hypothetical protein
MIDDGLMVDDMAYLAEMVWPVADTDLNAALTAVFGRLSLMSWHPCCVRLMFGYVLC